MGPPIKSREQILLDIYLNQLELIEMTAALDAKVQTVADQSNAISDAVSNAVTLITQLRTDIATGQSDNPATLEQLGSIANTLMAATNTLTTAVAG